MLATLTSVLYWVVLAFACWLYWRERQYAIQLSTADYDRHEEHSDELVDMRAEIANLTTELDASEARQRAAEQSADAYRVEYEKLAGEHISCINGERDKVVKLTQALELSESRYAAILDAARNLQRVIDLQTDNVPLYKGYDVFAPQPESANSAD